MTENEVKLPPIQEVKDKQGRKYSIARLQRLHDQGRLKTDAYQRKFIDRKFKWNTRLIESLLCGVDIGCVEMVKADDGNGGYLYYIVDGQHRLFTIMNYLRGKFSLSKPHLSKCDAKMFGKPFDKLPQYGQDRILDSDIYVYTYQEDEHHDAASIFLRRNDGHNSLNKMERLNAVWCRSIAYQKCVEFCHRKDWQAFALRHNMRFDAFRVLLEFLKDVHAYKNDLPWAGRQLEIDFYVEHLHNASDTQIKRALKSTEDFLEVWESISQEERWNTRGAWGTGSTSHSCSLLHVFFTFLFSALLESVKKTYLLEHASLIRGILKRFIPNYYSSFFPEDTDPRKEKIDVNRCHNLVNKAYSLIMVALEENGVCVDIDNPVSALLRQQILDERKINDHWIDEISGAKIFNAHYIDIDHRLPRSQGGKTDRSNLRITHRALNRSQRYNHVQTEK